MCYTLSMNGIATIQRTELKHIFANIGASLVAAFEQKPNSKLYKYHKAESKKYIKIALEMKTFFYYDKLTDRKFRYILYKHCKTEILTELSIISGINQEQKHKMAKELKNWFEFGVSQ